MPPIIGVTTCRTLADYLESIRRAGGEPRALEPGSADPAAILESVDGLLLTGGGDVDPARYGEPSSEKVHDVSAERDQFEIALVRLALERDTPLLGVCRGVQVLNVARGGSLVQDIPSELPGALGHTVGTPLCAIAHEVWINRESLLWRVMQEKLTEGEAVAVNSRHHQAVKRVAEGFEVSGTAPDGVIEAIELPGARFCLGVQWHPENFWRTGEFRPLFEGFVEAARGSSQ